MIFGAYSLEAGLFLHRLARRKLITFAEAVPLCCVGIMPLVTVVPMWYLNIHLGHELSFWQFLFPHLWGGPGHLWGGRPGFKKKKTTFKKKKHFLGPGQIQKKKQK